MRKPRRARPPVEAPHGDDEPAAGALVRRTAIVIGGGLAGLAAAQVLSSHFDETTLIERDQYPDGPTLRKGVPQMVHAHGMRAKGCELWEQLFPGLTGELLAHGCPEMQLGVDTHYYLAKGAISRFPSGLRTYPSSRALLEWVVRRRLAESRRIHILQGARVVSLIATERGRRVRGVRIAGSSPGLFADLVVDATGSHSHVIEWLRALGYGAPEELLINPKVAYATRTFRRPEGFRGDWLGLLVSPVPHENHRGAVLLPIEGNQWIATIACVGGESPPTQDGQAYIDFAKTLQVDLMFRSLENAEATSKIYAYRSRGNHRRYFERMRRWPIGFVVLGDAVCALNPIYAQGMTVAAQEAVLLDESLRKIARSGSLPDRFARRFQQRLGKLVDGAWAVSANEDLRYPETQGGRRGLKMAVLHRYLDTILELCGEGNATARQAFLEVTNLVAPASALLMPSLLRLVLARRLRRFTSTLFRPTRSDRRHDPSWMDPISHSERR